MGVRRHLAEPLGVHEPARRGGQRQEHEDEVGRPQHVGGPLRRDGRRSTCGRGAGVRRVPITRSSSAAALRGDLPADGAEAEDAERLPRQRLRDPARPPALALVERRRRVRLGQVEERRQDVLRHLDAVGPARARQDQIGRQVGPREPGLDAGGQRLHPAEAGRAGEEAGRHAPAEERLAALGQLGRRLGAGPDVVELHAPGEAGALRCRAVDLGLVGPQEDHRRAHWRHRVKTSASRTTSGTPPLDRPADPHRDRRDHCERHHRVPEEASRPAAGLEAPRRRQQPRGEQRLEGRLCQKHGRFDDDPGREPEQERHDESEHEENDRLAEAVSVAGAPPVDHVVEERAAPAPLPGRGFGLGGPPARGVRHPEPHQDEEDEVSERQHEQPAQRERPDAEGEQRPARRDAGQDDAGHDEAHVPAHEEALAGLAGGHARTARSR